jgi:organic radical activating enzyme
MSQRLKRTFELVNAVSPSFCAAKWYNASIWLSNGRTASCHHPSAHYIPTKELLRDPSSLHNTEFKKEQRRLMLAGDRPDECGYCWKVEDLKDENIFSDRAYKSMIYSPADIMKLMNSDHNENVDPKTLEICFDNLCNMSCSYCNSEFSSTWSSDISENGPYENLVTKGGHTYRNDGQHGMPFGSKNQGNFYISSFFKWYESSLRNNLEELRVSGGEPSRSPDFWRLVDTFSNERFNFAVNSNLMMDHERLDRLINIKNHFRRYDIYTSGESFGKNGEFVRSGLKYQEWKNNLYRLQTRGPEIQTHVMMTISAISVWTIDKFITDLMNLRKQTQIDLNTDRAYYHASVNILRFPSFQSINIIDTETKNILANNIELSLDENRYLMSDIEVSGFERLIAYLRQVERGYEDTDSYDDKTQDFYNFVIEYSKRKKMPISEYMPENFINWFNNILD